jgi:hypothetical protein
MSTTIEPHSSARLTPSVTTFTPPPSSEPRARAASESPTPRQRAVALLGAYANARDAHERLLAREMIAHYREYCTRAGIGDPFTGPRR